MPADDEDVARKRLKPEAAGGGDEAADDHGTSPADHGAIAERNDDQAAAVVGAGAGAEDEDEDNWWDAPAPRVKAEAPPPPPTRHRRGTPLMASPTATPLAHHRRNAGMLTGRPVELPRHRRGTPLMTPTDTLEKSSGITDEMASKNMARRQAMTGKALEERASPGVSDGFAGHGGGKRNKPSVAPALAGDDKDNDQMRHVALKQRQGVQADLAGLGGGRAPGYRGKDEATGDARAIVEDPRFAMTYGIDREGDKGGAAGRVASEKLAGLKEFWNSDDKATQLGKGAARTAVRKLPFVGSGLAIGGAVKEHNRAGVDDEVAEDESQDDLTRSTAVGLAGSHRKMRNKEAVSGTVGLVKDVVDVSTGGLSAMIPGIPGAHDAAADAGGSLIDRATHKAHKAVAPEKLATSAGMFAGKKGGGAGVNAGVDYFGDEPVKEAHELRPDAVAPTGAGQKSQVVAKTDQANEGLMKLARGDGKFGAKMLTHLNADMPGFEDTAEPDQAKRDKVQRPGGTMGSAAPQAALDAARTADPRAVETIKPSIRSKNEIVREHNLRPSEVSRMVAGEGARQRQKARMGGALGKLTDNETSRSWWEKSAGVDVKGPKAKPEAAEDEAEEA